MRSTRICIRYTEESDWRKYRCLGSLVVPLLLYLLSHIAVCTGSTVSCCTFYLLYRRCTVQGYLFAILCDASLTMGIHACDNIQVWI